MSDRDERDARQANGAEKNDPNRQEFALATAEDNALVVSLNATVTVPRGTFTHCLKTLETTPLEPDARENKYYASGVGNVLTVDLEAGERIKLVKTHPNNE